MPTRQFELKHHRRIIFIIIGISILFILGVSRLFSFQLVQGEEFLKSTQRSSKANVRVSSARGEILDINNIPFTQNKAIFNVEFDYNFMIRGTENEIIDNLIEVFRKNGEIWIDTLPITMSTPYEFKENMDSDIAKLKRVLDVNTYATANDCMEQIFRQTGIKKYENKRGNCTHCGEDYEKCDYKGYDEIASRRIAGVRAGMLSKQFSASNSRYVFCEDVSTELVAVIKELSNYLVGVEIVQKAQRTYVSGDVASHLIGSMGPIFAEEVEEYRKKGYTINDIVGKSGIEREMEDVLRGQDGNVVMTKNTNGEVVDIEETKIPVAGNNVKLTIDFEFQKQVQIILDNYIRTYNSTNDDDKTIESASVVVLKTDTNGVLASISYPYYDISGYKENYNELLNATGSPLVNYALNGKYRPGSTFKPVVATAGLLEGVLAPDTEIYCGGTYTFWGTEPGDYKPTCLSNGHRNQNMNLDKSLKYSCNIFSTRLEEF